MDEIKDKDDLKQAATALLKDDEFHKAIEALTKLPPEWLGHVILQHGYIHGDKVAIMGAVKATEWLREHLPEGVKDLPELMGCLAAQIMVWTGKDVTELSTLTPAEWVIYAEETIINGDEIDARAERYIATEKAKIVAEEGFVLADPDWDKVVH
jgi:hypothetical protein